MRGRSSTSRCTSGASPADVQHPVCTPAPIAMLKTHTASPILLVEDNPDDVLLTQRAFAKSGIQNDLVVARDGVEALQILLGEGGEGMEPLPMLILLDLKLPRVDGLEVLQRIRQEPRTKRVPVVVLTTSREEQDLITSYDLGANSYVRKPVDFDDFHEAVRTLGMYWLLLNERPPV